jgi:hypothetical protein
VLIANLHRLSLVYSWPKVVGVSSEGNSEQFKEAIHAIEKTLGCMCNCVHRGLSFKHDHSVSQVSCHDEIVLYHKTSFLGMENEPAEENI